MINPAARLRRGLDGAARVSRSRCRRLTVRPRATARTLHTPLSGHVNPIAGAAAVGAYTLLAAVLAATAAAASRPPSQKTSTLLEAPAVPKSRERTLAFVPNDPLAAKQWYLSSDHAFDAWVDIALPPSLPGVRVAVIDSGIDGAHPDLQGRIALRPSGAPLARSFVDNSPLTDESGHGTFVAGEIAAATDNGIGISGIAFPAQLVIAKVVEADGTIPVGAEAAAIRWATDVGARVINLSFGGVRDPFDTSRDTYSRVEASAIAYAVSKGAVIVAAVGNGDGAPSEPWLFADYPAALPHVIGVSAYAADGSVPDFSNRDMIYNDLAAPGVNLLSTFPTALTAPNVGCTDQGYSDCATITGFVHAEGTSFGTPQVSAAAALLLSLHPNLSPDQSAWILERSANDMTPQTGCSACSTGRDALSGWGKLDIARALELANSKIPPVDSYEPNNDINQAATLPASATRLQATIDYWDNPIDTYRTRLQKDQWLAASLHGTPKDTLSLSLWRPGTTTVITPPQHAQQRRILESRQAGPDHQLLYQALTPGWYYIEIKAITATHGTGAYTLEVSKNSCVPTCAP